MLPAEQTSKAGIYRKTSKSWLDSSELDIQRACFHWGKSRRQDGKMEMAWSSRARVAERRRRTSAAKLEGPPVLSKDDETRLILPLEGTSAG